MNREHDRDLSCDGWDRLAEHVTRIVDLTKRIADLSRRLIPPAPLPWRVSQWGNVVDARGAVVVRFYGPTRRDRKSQAAPYLARYMQQRADMEAERASRRIELEALQPAEPGKLFGALDVPDLRRVTTAQAAEAIRLATGGAVLAEPLQGGAVAIRPRRMYFAPGSPIGFYPGPRQPEAPLTSASATLRRASSPATRSRRRSGPCSAHARGTHEHVSEDR